MHPDRKRPVGRAGVAVSLLGIAIVLGPPAAWAGEGPVATVVDPQADWTIAGQVVGAATLLLPFLAGSMLFAQDDQTDRQRLGIGIMAVGFAAGPWVAHVNAGRPRRALAFGLASVTLSAATVTFMEARNPFGSSARDQDIVAFGLIFTSALVAAVAGIIDGFLLAGSADIRS